MPSEALSVTGLGKAYRLFPQPWQALWSGLSGGRWGTASTHVAVEDISFNLSAGETLGVMGRNGAGKTTLLGLLAGTILPTHGTIRCPARVGTLIALGAGFDPASTGRDNLRQWGALHVDGRFNPTEEAWICDFTELGEALDRPLKTYSQGMLLRLGFAVATVRRPDLLLIDEVMAVGDFFFRRKCHERIQAFVAQSTAAVLVSHDYTEILQFCRRALVLERGQVAFLGDAATAVNRYLHAPPALAIPATTEIEGRPDPGSACAALPWPDDSQCVDVRSRTDWITNGARVCSLACCDSTLGQRWVFSQGEMVSFFVGIEAETDLQVPIVSVVITDERGVVIHGSSTHMKGQSPSSPLQRGQKMRVRCDLGLALRYGEYQVDVSFGDCPPEIFRQRQNLTFEALGAAVRQLGRLSRVGIIAVVPRQGGTPAQLTHHGIADLPGTMTTVIG